MEIVKESKVEKTKVKYYTYDFALLFIVLFIIVFGLVMIYSSSAYISTRKYGDAMYYLKRQGKFAVVGVAVMLIVSKIPYHIYYRFMKIRPIFFLYIACFGMQLYTLIQTTMHKGSKRWIELPLIGTIQPSEFTKICVILLTAYIAYLAPKKMSTIKGFIRAAIYVMPLVMMVAVENLSTSIVMSAIFIVICFITSKKKGYFFYFVLPVALAAVVALIIFKGYRFDRIDAWLNVETSAKGEQILQGLYAIASGGLFGRGLGESVQKLSYIPEAHNDMIFSIICEELGIVGAVALILIYVLILWRIYVIAMNAEDLLGSLICIGVMVHIGIQVIINIAVVTSVIPATGIPLPFVSYGGSSLIALLMELGIVLNVSDRTEYTYI